MSHPITRNSGAANGGTSDTTTPNIASRAVATSSKMGEIGADLSISIAGRTISDRFIRHTLGLMDPTGFTRTQFCDAFATMGEEPLDADSVRKLLQHLKRRGVARYDAISKHWILLTADFKLPMFSGPTLPLKPLMVPTSNAPPVQSTSFVDHLQGWLHLSLTHLTCLAAVLALIVINAGFAWELAESEAFRFAFVAGLLASDLMRPLLVARGLWEFGRWNIGRGVIALSIALALAPVSILSSTSVISASLFLGVEENVQNAARQDTRRSLADEHKRLKREAEQAWMKWQEECDRGGCGKQAAAHHKVAKSIEQEARQTLIKMTALTEASNTASAFIARTVKSLEALNLYGEGRAMLIPLLLALTLELSALFGPALLLQKGRGGA